MNEIGNITATRQHLAIEEKIYPTQAEARRIDLEERIRQVQMRITTLEAKLESIPDGEMLQLTHEKVQKLRMEKEQKVILGKALETAMNVLSEASLVIRQDYVPGISREMESILHEITEGKYHDVKADDGLLLNILPDETTERVLPEQLSAGTADQIYLALRLSAVRVVEKGAEKIPLFLDEPFMQYDEVRTKNTLQFLLKESEKRQILLFTCKKREVELAQELADKRQINIVELGS